MKILFITTAFNGLAQRAWIELDRLDCQVRVQIATDDEAMIKAVEDYRPELIICPFLKKKLPETIWKNHTCLIIHPGIVGDRGGASLDWAVLDRCEEWGVTILQAVEKMDAGPVWATRFFLMREINKAKLYRHEVTQAAMAALLEAVERFRSGSFAPLLPEDFPSKKRDGYRRLTTQSDFAFSWNDDTSDILRKMRAADSDPGVLRTFFGRDYYCYGAWEEGRLNGSPGQILARRDDALCVATGDGAVWITHLKPAIEGAIKLPACMALGEQALSIPEVLLSPFDHSEFTTFREIRYEEANEVGYLHFEFYNGAMSASQCRRLQAAFVECKKRPVKVIVLLGGSDVWSNGIHLNIIEAAENPADQSWDNINAIDDLIREIIACTTHYVISAMQGNAGAGGVALALAADKVLARNGVVLNPHTRNMGLYGSEYWTYSLPYRIGQEKADQATEQCLPWGTAISKELGLIDDCFGDTAAEFVAGVRLLAEDIAGLPYYDKLIGAKQFERRKKESYKPLATYREAELAEMRRNFYENNWGYEYKRYCFVHKLHDEFQQAQIEQKDLYSERRKIFRRRKWESYYYD